MGYQNFKCYCCFWFLIIVLSCITSEYLTYRMYIGNLQYLFGFLYFTLRNKPASLVFTNFIQRPIIFVCGWRDWSTEVVTPRIFISGEG